jgi:pilus assembly protein CpaE
MRAGVREFLSESFDQNAVAEALRNVQDLVQKRPPRFDEAHQILSFIPSKAGVGTTTLALNITAALARPGDKRVLLTDLDLNSGMLRFLLQLFPEYSIIDAVENVENLDEVIWPQVTTSRFNMDLLHSGRVNPNLRIEPEQVSKLLTFVRRNYDSLVFDHSGNLERYSLEVMQESKQIFLVCTPEIPSLHLAREKMTFLKSLGLDSRVFLLLNRVPKRSMFTVDQVEELVGVKVAYSFSNDYYAVNRATTQAECLAPDSVIGAQCADFVRNLGDLRAHEKAAGGRRKFLEFFTTQSQELFPQT